MPKSALQILADDVVACSDCPRLVAHRRNMAEVKRRAYRDWDYWGKPVPPFGDPRPRHMEATGPGACLQGTARVTFFTGLSTKPGLHLNLRAMPSATARN